MKYGVRTPSVRKSISARTSGRVTRSINRSVNPYYGKKGMGWVNNPRKAGYNKVYNKTSCPSVGVLVFLVTLVMLSPIIIFGLIILSVLF
mgnify:FL=1